MHMRGHSEKYAGLKMKKKQTTPGKIQKTKPKEDQKTPQKHIKRSKHDYLNLIKGIIPLRGCNNDKEPLYT